MSKSLEYFKNSEKYLNLCGIIFPQPEGISYFFNQENELFEITYIFGDGHTASKQKQLKISEDENFKFIFSWLKDNQFKGWTIHVIPKHLPISQEMHSVFEFLPFKEFAKCPFADFEQCFYIQFPYKENGSIIDSNTDIVHRNFDAFHDNFSKGIENIINSQKELEPYDFYILPLLNNIKKRITSDLLNKIKRDNKASATGIFQSNFDVSLSFASTERPLAEKLAKILGEKGIVVFYDDFFPEQLWGKELPVFLTKYIESIQNIV